MYLRVRLCTLGQKSFRVGRTVPLVSTNDGVCEGKRGSSGILRPAVSAPRLMRLLSHSIPRKFPSAPQRLPRPFLFLIARPSHHSLNPTSVAACAPYSRLYNSTVTSTPTASADVDPNLIIQRVPSDGGQSTPMREYNKLVEAGTLRPDEYQTEIIQKLQALHDALALYDPPPLAGPPSLVKVFPFPFPPYSTETIRDFSFHVSFPVPHRALRAMTDRGDCICMVTSEQERLCSWTSSTTHSLCASLTSGACTSTHSCLMSISECMLPRLPAQVIRFYPSHKISQMRRTYYAWTSSK